MRGGWRELICPVRRRRGHADRSVVAVTVRSRDGSPQGTVHVPAFDAVEAAEASDGVRRQLLRYASDVEWLVGLPTIEGICAIIRPGNVAMRFAAPAWAAAILGADHAISELDLVEAILAANAVGYVTLLCDDGLTAEEIGAAALRVVSPAVPTALTRDDAPTTAPRRAWGRGSAVRPAPPKLRKPR